MAQFADGYGDLHITAQATSTPTVKAAQEPPTPKIETMASNLIKKMSSGLKLKNPLMSRPVSDPATPVAYECPSLETFSSDGDDQGRNTVHPNSQSVHSEPNSSKLRRFLSKIKDSYLFKAIKKIGSSTSSTIQEPISVPFSDLSRASAETGTPSGNEHKQVKSYTASPIPAKDGKKKIVLALSEVFGLKKGGDATGVEAGASEKEANIVGAIAISNMSPALMDDIASYIETSLANEKLKTEDAAN